MGAARIRYMHVETGSRSDPGIDGGIWKGQSPTAPAGSRPNAFNCSIEVADIDETLAKVKASGGLVVREKAQIPGVGWLAMCTDTEGNTFGVMQR